MEKIVESFELYGKQYRLETGELAKQATGAVLVTQGETTVLVTAVVSKQERDYDFFPLTVDFIEKMYAVGRIPGGYLKREARPSDKGTPLHARPPCATEGASCPRFALIVGAALLCGSAARRGFRPSLTQGPHHAGLCLVA